MRFEDKVFTVVNDQPRLSAVGLNIPAFMKLWEEDTTEDKSQYAKELAFVYHMCTYRSPYYDVVNKQEAIGRDYMGDKKYKPSKRVTDAVSVFVEMQNSSELRALDAATSSADMIAKDLRNMEMESVEFNKLIKEIDVYVKIELMGHKMKLQENKLKINDQIVGLSTKLEKQIESIKLLRERVTKAEYSGEMSSMIDSFLIDDILEDLKNE
jgi:hypothetical protein